MRAGPLQVDVGYRYKKIVANSALSSVLGLGRICSRIRYDLVRAFVSDLVTEDQKIRSFLKKEFF